MEFFSHPIIAIGILLGVLVIVHELGHFLCGRAFGIPVEIFSIGFGPAIINFRKNETQYRLSLIPLGGYVKFYGALPSEVVPESVRGREYFRSSAVARLATISAGPIANMILAVFVFAGMGIHGIQQPPPVIGEIIAGSPAERAGLKLGDTITSINDEPIKTWKEIQRKIGGSANKELRISVTRGSETRELTILPDIYEDEELFSSRGRIGISRVMVPAVITTLTSGGIFADAGLTTGDRLRSVVWREKTYEIEQWKKFLEFLQLVSNEKRESNELILLKVEKFLPPTAVDQFQNLKQPRDVLVSLPPEWKYSPADFMQTSGVTHSQLTIFSGEEGQNQLIQGDILRSWGDTEVSNFFDLSKIMASHTSEQVELGVLRAGKFVKINVSLKPIEVQNAKGKGTFYSLPYIFWGGPEEPEWIVERYSGFSESVAFGIKETWEVSKNILGSLIGLFTGKVPLTTLGGPIAIANVASESVKVGWQAFLSAMALISINLGLLNLVPIPILDGGQIVLVVAELVVRRPIKEVAIENYQKIGFVMILALIVIATYNDIGRFWASMLRGMNSLF